MSPREMALTELLMRKAGSPTWVVIIKTVRGFGYVMEAAEPFVLQGLRDGRSICLDVPEIVERLAGRIEARSRPEFMGMT